MVRRVQQLTPLIGLAVFVFALWVLHRELAHLHLRDVGAQLRALPWPAVVAAVGLTVVSYLALTGYDTLSVRSIGLRLPYRRTGLASFLGYAVSQNVGLTVFSGAPIRFRLYTAWGLSAVDIASLIAFNALTFWLGMLSVGGLAFTIAGGDAPAALHLPVTSLRPIGVLFLLLATGYVVACATLRRPLRIRGREVQLPGPGLAAAQLAVSTLDWTASATVLWVLMPAEVAVPFGHFVAVYMLAQSLGLLSQVPGGLGVFETVVLVLLPPGVDSGVMVGTLVAYRAIYYLLPLAAAVALMLAYELRQRGEAVGRVARAVGGGLTVVAPRVLALTTFLGGVVLLVSGATPAVDARLRWLDRLLPLPVVELSHFLGSVAGVLLLLLAWGLRRRLQSAWVLTMILLATGVVVSLAKGLDYEEAVVLAAMLAALAPARRHFYRKAPLLSEPLSGHWLAAVTMVLVGALWIGLFAYRHVDYSDELWWQFELLGNASRFMRAGIGVALVLLLTGVARLLGPAAPRDRTPTADDLERVRAIVAGSPKAEANLALLGDKRFLLSDSGRSMIMYGVAGRSWVAMGDPVGPAEEHAELVWRFHAMCDHHGGWTVFYEVGEDHLDLYLELGLAVLKIGEEAVVPLDGFSLEGSARKGLRYVKNKLERGGCSFEVLEAAQVEPMLPELRRISDAWLAEKHSREKGFSLGFFDEAYLRQLPLAVIRCEGRVVAFANLWPGAGGGELSIDLMRYLPDAPGGTMDFLFLHLMGWGRDHGFSEFRLGMAPLSGIRSGPFTPLWNQLAALAYRHGEYFYGFQGLRQYKEKFGPVWRPRFLVCPGGRAVSGVMADLSRLISGGLLGAIGR